MSDTLPTNEPGERPSSPWPAPHPVIDAPYGPRYEAPPPAPVDTPRALLAPGPLPPTPRPKTWLIVFAAICLVVAAIGGIVAYQFVTNDNTPAKWDSKVADLATFVEKTTQMTFVHPVKVKFLDDAAFEKLVTQPSASLTDQDRKALADDEAVGRAFGWYTGTTKVFDERNTLNAAGILAFYSFDDRDIVARSDDPGATTLPVDLRVTLVHEMTHAMQDQRLNIRKLQQQAKGVDAQQAITGLIEGHATFVEDQYIASLSASDLDAYDKAIQAAGTEANQKVSDVAPVLSVPLGAPYVYGPVLVDAASHTRAGTEQLFARPPASMDQVVDPRAYFADDPPEKTTTPAPGGTLIPSGTVGVVKLYLTLATAMSPADAWAAAMGWGNDVYQPYVAPSSTQTCLSWNVYADSPDTAATLLKALGTWAATRDTAAKVVVGTGTDPINVTMCDPGTGTTQKLVDQTAVQWFYVRANVLGSLLDKSGDLGKATCATDELQKEYAPDVLAQAGEAVKARADALLSSCP